MGRVEDVKTKLSCEASYKSYKFQKVEDVKKEKLPREASVKFQETKLSEHVFNAAGPMHKVS